MGNFFIGDETVRVEYPDSQWVDVKQELTQADQDYVLNQMVGKGLRTDRSGTADVSVDLGKLALMERMITGWSFQEDGKPVTVNRENISRLRRKYREPLLQRIDELNSAAGEWSKNSGKGST